MADRIPISELEEITTITEDHYIPVDDGNATNKITVENFNETASTSARAYAEAAAASATSAQSSAEAAATDKSEIDLSLNTAAELVNSASTYANNASASKDAAAVSATSANSSATRAATYANNVERSVGEASDYATLSRSWAEGNTGARIDEATNNAKYWAGVAASAAGGGVVAFNGRDGAVVPEAGDYDSSLIQVFTDSSSDPVYLDVFIAHSLAIEENGTNPSKNYAKGELIIRGGALYRTTEAIETTDSIDSTNIELASLSSIFGQIQAVIDNINAHAVFDTDYATPSDAGIVKPDNDTITVGANGVLSAVAGGSIVKVTTTESTLIGESVSITDGTDVKTAVFDENGVAIITGVNFIGNLTVSATDGSQTAQAVVTAPYFGVYELSLAFWQAIVGLYTPSSEFYGQTVNVARGGVSVGSVTFSNLGTATYYAPEAGNYTFSVTYSGETFSEELAVTAETTYSVELSYYTLYGFHIDGNESNPADMISYEVQYNNKNVDNYSFTPAHMDYITNKIDPGDWNLENDFFVPRSCMLKYDGTVDYYLDEDDETKKEDGTASDVANTSYGGNAMMEWGRDGKKIWIKCVPDENDAYSATFYVSDRQIDAGFHDWPFYNQNGAQISHCYTAKYNGVNVSSKLRSISGQAILNNVAGATEITYANANNVNGATEWYIETYADRMMINVLLLMIGANTNSQATFGNGHYTGGSSASNLLRTGTMNGKGQFYGTNGTGQGVKVFGMENYWGNQWRRTAGLVNIRGVVMYKLTWSTADGSTATGYNETGTGYLTASGVTPGGTSGGYINKEKYFSDGVMIPNTASGSDSTYYTDGLWFNNSQNDYALCGGDCYDGLLVGALCVDLDDALSFARWDCGAALSCKPLAA